MSYKNLPVPKELDKGTEIVRMGHDPTGNLVVILRDDYNAAGAWGVVIADLIGHIRDGRAATGIDPLNEIMQVLLSELKEPTSNRRGRFVITDVEEPPTQ